MPESQYMKYVNADEMKAIDKKTADFYKIPSILLMENAGRSVSDEILKHFYPNDTFSAAVFCGKGNNGGDGFAAARHLCASGIKVAVYLLCFEKDIKKGDSFTNFRPLKAMGIRVEEITSVNDLNRIRQNFNYDVVCDAIFGTGFSGKLPGHIIDTVEFINMIDTVVFSVDVPSGLDATEGSVRDNCINACFTVTFGLPKTGFIKGEGPARTGKVIVKNISFPRDVL